MYSDCSPGWTGDLGDNKGYSVGYSLELPTEYPTNYTEASEWLGDLGKPLGSKRVSEVIGDWLVRICPDYLLVERAENGRAQGITALCWLMLSHPAYGFIHADDRGKWVSESRQVFGDLIESLKAPQVKESVDLFEVELVDEEIPEQPGEIILSAANNLEQSALSLAGPGVALAMPKELERFAKHFGEFQGRMFVSQLEKSFNATVNKGVGQIASRMAAATEGGCSK